MSILNNKGNPIVFYDESEVANYYTKFPNPYNMIPGTQHIDGMYALPHKKDWINNSKITLQFQITGDIAENIDVYKLNEISNEYSVIDSIYPEEITPDGWLSSKVNKYEYTPTSKGQYYLNFAGAGYVSQTIVVHDSLKWQRRLNCIEYSNSRNDYGMVFYDNGTQIFEGKTYFEGTAPVRKIFNEISGFTSDRGGFEKTRSTPVELATLTIDPAHTSELAIINTIFACDNIVVNDILYQNEEAPQDTPIEKTDCVSVVVNLREQNTDYFTK